MKINEINIQKVDLRIGDKIKIDEKRSQRSKFVSFQKIFEEQLQIQGIESVSFNLTSNEKQSEPINNISQIKFRSGYSIHIPQEHLDKNFDQNRTQIPTSNPYNFASHNLSGKLVNLTF